jgi:hypothetical protein
MNSVAAPTAASLDNRADFEIAWRLCGLAEHGGMVNAPSVHSVRVTTDDRKNELWAVANSRAGCHAGFKRCVRRLDSGAAVQQLETRASGNPELQADEVRNISAIT